MKFVTFVADSREIRLQSAKPIASAIFPVQETAYYYGDAESQIELVQPRLFGWLRQIFPDKRTWVMPIVSDDAYPLRFEQPAYRAERADSELGANEAAAHQVTYDVAMTEIQKSAGSTFWNLPITVMIIGVTLAFLLMILTWIYTGAFA